MIELYRGSVNAWECDELGHLNVRYYLWRAMEGAGALADALGLRRAFGPEASATLIARDIHVRFLSEAHAGAPLAMEGGVLDHGETELTAYFILRHGVDNRPAAGFRLRFDHADPRSARPFPWPSRAREPLRALTVEPVAGAGPRSLDPAEAPEPEMTLERADALGLVTSGRGRFSPADMDAFGRMAPELCLGKISDSVGTYTEGFPELAPAMAGREPLRLGNPLLEARMAIRRYPRLGDGFVVRSGVAWANETVRTLVHWVFDPLTGAALWSNVGVSAMMDLQARKLVKTAPDVVAQLNAAATPGLRL